MKLTSLNELSQEAVSHNKEIQKKVMLRKGDLPHLTNFSMATFPPHQTAAAHFHSDMCEVFFVQSGSGTICIDGTDYPLQPGTCIAVEPGESHEISNPGSSDLVILYFGLQVGA
ncbi:MAG: cupin domain-containing protein [Actinomycetota bacterium]